MPADATEQTTAAKAESAIQAMYRGAGKDRARDAFLYGKQIMVVTPAPPDGQPDGDKLLSVRLVLPAVTVGVLDDPAAGDAVLTLRPGQDRAAPPLMPKAPGG